MSMSSSSDSNKQTNDPATASTGTSSSTSSKSAADIANFAIRQSPSTTRFVTNGACPFAQKVWIALEVCNAPYDMVQVELYGRGGKPHWFLELNPDGTVPILECYGGAVVLPDSDLILSELMEKGNTIVEGGNTLQVQSKETQRLVQTLRDDIAYMLPIGKAVVLGDRSRRKDLEACWKTINDRVVGPYLCGEYVTIADCAAFPFLWRLEQEYGFLNNNNNNKKNEYSKLSSWLNKCVETQAFAKTVQSNWWWWW